MVTIGDVAREAGVARSTVSAVLTGRKLVMPETRARVEAAIARLDYSVNSGARALATSRTMPLGLVVRFHGADFSPALAAYLIGICDAARARGYEVLLITDLDGPSAIRRAAAARQVDGLVLLSVLEEDPRLVAIAESRIPAVLIGMPTDPGPADAVDLDFAAAARLMVDHLVGHGVERATFLTWPAEFLASGSTFATRFRAAAQERAVTAGLALATVSMPSEPGPVRAALRAALTGPAAPRALLVHNDSAVAMLPTVARSLALDGPGDLDVVSLHSAELAQLYALAYARVESQPETIATLAVEMLVTRLLDGSDAAPQRVFVPPVLTPAEPGPIGL